MFLFDYAIELGSTYTTIYKSGLGVVLKEPSLIAIQNDGNRKVLKCVGSEAKSLIGKTGAGIDVFEPIVEDVIINKQLTKLMLKEFFKRIDVVKTSKIKVAFSVPVGISAKERNTLLNLAYSLNFHTVALIPSCISSLVGFGVDITKPNSYMVVNIGGGVSDIAIVTQGSIVRGGSVTISGKSLGNVIDSYLRETHSLMVTQNVRNEILRELVSLYENDQNSLKIWGLDVDTKNRRELMLNTKEIYHISSFFFTQLVGVIETLLNMSSSEVIADVAKHGIMVCGELANTTGLERFLKEKLKYNILIDSDDTNIYGLGTIIENKELFDIAISNFK